jgi:AbrB family transcriptional regulator, transcriptional pleiotropic regulator of transition state genes
MKATGVVRKLDNLGRIVLPIDLRRCFEMNVKDDVEIFTVGDSIVMKRYTPACVFCGENENVGEYKSKRICGSCLDELKRK